MLRVLLDTHAFLWWLDGDRRLPRSIRELVAEEANVVLVSAASAWEICTKARLGKLPGAADVAAHGTAVVSGQGFAALSITMAHAQRAGELPGPLRDPFDRMLIAQSLIEDVPLVTNERAFDRYGGLSRLWT